MSWIFKSIALTTLAACGVSGFHLAGGDRVVFERLIRAAGGSERRADTVVTRDMAVRDARAWPETTREQSPATTSKALSVRAGSADGDMAAAATPRIEGFVAGHVRMAQAPSSAPDSAGAAPSQPQSKPPADDVRRRLAGAIQAELKRVGCYAGELDGNWGQASQRAMKAFNDRIKATLPISQPDYILLTLLQGHATMACGAACPMGEVDAGDGSCKPRAVVAEGRLRSTPAEAAPQAQSLAQSAVTERGATAGQGAREADNQRARRAAEADRLRPKNEAEARLQDTVRQAAEAQAKAETARREAAELAQRKSESDNALAAAERARIAAAEARRRQQTAEIEARAEAERLARVAEAEKARIAAEANRRRELDALANRIVADQRVLTSAQVQGEPERGFAARTSDREPAPPWNSAAVRGYNEDRFEQAAAPRFVGRFVPPPSYRLGRLPEAPFVKSRAAKRPVIRAVSAAPRSSRPSPHFNYLDRNSP